VSDLRVSDEDRDSAVGEIRVPALPLTPAQRTAALSERRDELRAQLLQEAGGGVVLFGICTVVWATAGAHEGMFWPMWIALVVLLPLIRSSWRLYGPVPDFERVEHDLAQFRRRRQRQESRQEARRRR
jgi:hypothetical protein